MPAIKKPQSEMTFYTREIDGREIQRVKIPPVADHALDPFFAHPELFGAIAEGKFKIVWELDLSLSEEIALWIIRHADELPEELRAAMRQDIELPQWTGI